VIKQFTLTTLLPKVDFAFAFATLLAKVGFAFATLLPKVGFAFATLLAKV